MNEIRIKDEMLLKLEKMGNFQIEVSKNPEMNQFFLKKHAQKIF
jgi:hypothetical protein